MDRMLVNTTPQYLITVLCILSEILTSEYLQGFTARTGDKSGISEYQLVIRTLNTSVSDYLTDVINK